ncbi:MAG TPA: ATP-binding cassette domain-containing protein [Bordetella sp.]
MPAIELDRVRLALGGRTVLDDVSLAIEQREFIGVLGANGAGKTTLMRAVLGLVEPAAGRIRVLGDAARRGNPAIGYLPQTRAIAPAVRLSGRHVVASALNGHRLGLAWQGKAARREVDRVLDLTGARDLAERPIAELSGGERQRLLLAQALLGRPELLLLDEPLVSLDPRRQQAMVDLVKALQAELGITVLLSAHELHPLLGALDRVLYLGQRHAALGTVEEVVTGPVLSRLYGTRIDVVRAAGRLFVIAGGVDAETDAHRHEAHA